MTEFLNKYREMLELTERIKELVCLKEYDKLPDLLNERQKVLMEIQSFDGLGPAPHLKEGNGEVSRIVEKITEVDREIRLRIACEMDTLSRELKDIKNGRDALRGYRAVLSP